MIGAGLTDTYGALPKAGKSHQLTLTYEKNCYCAGRDTAFELVV
jgi:hypothetical protein